MRMFFLVFMISILISCGRSEKGYYQSSTLYIDKMIENNLNSYTQNSNPHNNATKSSYLLVKQFDNRTDAIISKMGSNGVSGMDWNDYLVFVEDSVLPYYGLAKSDNGQTKYLDELKELKVESFIDEEDRNETIRNIKLIELMILEHIQNSQSQLYFPVNMVKANYRSKQDRINLGDTYEANIDMDSWNTYSTFIAVVDGDTLDLDSTGYPIFRFKPDSRGKRKHKGYVDNPYSPYNDSLSFVIEYDVE